MEKIPEIIRSIVLTKEIKGVKIANALRSIAPHFGSYEQILTRDVDGSRTHDIGILKDNEYLQTGYIMGSILDDGIITSGITFDKEYRSGDKIAVANHKWDNCHDYDNYKYDEKKAIQSIESLRDCLGAALLNN